MIFRQGKMLCLCALVSGFSSAHVYAQDAIAAGDGSDFTCGTQETSAMPLAKTEALPVITKVWSGTLKALVIRVAFSDAPYATDTSIINKTNAGINTLYNNMSRNTFQWTWGLYPQILQAPGAGADYAANFATLQSWIASQISAAGLKRGVDYDVYVASFPQINVGWAGLSNLREADWINGAYSVGVTGHELGHSLGLPHAHSIEAGPDMFGTPGTTSETNEYGNPFDIMGHGGSTGHFNILYKWRIGWEDADEIQEVKNSGTYRIYAQDNALHKGRLIGIRVPSGNVNYAYWFEYRTVSSSARNGASVLFQGFKTPTNLDDWFMDTTPGSRLSSDETDGVLAVGKSFTDKYGPAVFKTLAINTGVWNQDGYVDLQVTIPGSTPVTPIAVPLAAARLRGLDAPVFDLAGRALERVSLPTLMLKSENGKADLVLNAR